MATSGSKSVSVTSYNTLKFSWERKSYSIEDNKSTIGWKMELIATSNGKISSSSSKDWSVTVNGTKYSGTNKIGISANSTITLASGSTTIAHNTDGSKTFSYSFSQEFGITFSGSSIGTKSGSGSGTLDTIPRKATISSAPNFNDEESPVIKYSNPAGSAVSALEACIKDSAGEITFADYRSISKTGTSYTFSLTDAERKALRKAITKGNTLSVKYYIRTTIGENKYYSTATKTLTLVNYKPTLSPVIKDTGSGSTALTGDGDNKIIKYFNYMSITTGAAARKEATVKSVKVTCGSKSISKTTGVLENVESATFDISVTDSRGYTTTQTVKKTLINYVKLTCDLSAKATLAADNTTTINFTAKGNFFNGSFGKSNNSLTIQYRYKTSSASSYGSWTTLTPSKSGNTYTATGSLSGLDYQTTYNIQARAIDSISTGGINSSVVNVKSTPVFDWGAEDFKFNVPVNMAGSLYGSNGRAGALNMNNSDITGCNSIYFADESGNATEGIHFYRDGTNTDSLWAKGGNLYFTPNYPAATTNYNITGLFKAITSTYQLTATATAGTGYTVEEVSAYLTGNMLRMYIRVIRSSNATAGDMTNEKVAAVKVTHSGKISGMNNISFSSGTRGAVASFNTTNISTSDTTLEFDIELCATSAAENDWSSYFTVPVKINPDKY